MEKDLSTVGHVGKYKKVIHFTDDAAAAITTIMCVRKDAPWRRQDAVNLDIPLDARKMYMVKSKIWASDAAERAEQAIEDARLQRKIDASAMRRSLVQN